MDHFGIGAAIKGAVNIYFRSTRRTGKTVSMIDSLKDGDRVIFTDAKEANRVNWLFKEAGKNVVCIVVNPKETERLLGRGTIQGRTIFDHSWVEEFYLSAIERCEKDIDYLQRELSGSGEPHRETRRKAAKIARWRF